MDRKPLSAYNPNAARSRLAVEDAPRPRKDASNIVFNDRFCVHKRRFVTTHQNYHDGHKPNYCSNPGMVATATSIKKKLQES